MPNGNPARPSSRLQSHYLFAARFGRPGKGTCLAGQAVGIKEIDDGIWLVSFMHYDLGYVDLEEKTLQPLENPFGPKVLPICPVRTKTKWGGWWDSNPRHPEPQSGATTN